jgi:hypothetical protein
MESDMRTLIFGTVLLAVATVGFHTLISASLAEFEADGTNDPDRLSQLKLNRSDER